MNFSGSDLEGFRKTVSRIFSKHAPINRKYVRASEAPFMTTELHKAIMKISKLRNNFLNSRLTLIGKLIHHNEIFVKKLLKNTKSNYFNNLTIKEIVDDRTFRKTIFLLFSNKFSKSEKISL